MKLKQKDFSQTKTWICAAQKAQLLPLIAASFADVDAQAYFDKYFVGDDAYERKLRLYYANSKVVGYCLLTFHQLNNQYIVKASAAFYPEYRQGGNTFNFSLSQVMKLKLKHPLSQVYYADTMLSPAMYRAMAKNVAIVYPSDKMPANVESLYQQFNPQGRYSEVANCSCLLETGRKTNYSEAELTSLYHSEKPEISYYCKVNPAFSEGTALFVIMPVTFSQLWLTALKLLKVTR